jgi:hypothetical protein
LSANTPPADPADLTPKAKIEEYGIDVYSVYIQPIVVKLNDQSNRGTT